jgi:hypothetical protein
MHLTRCITVRLPRNEQPVTRFARHDLCQAYHLRGGVEWAAAEGVQKVVCGKRVAEAKVHDLDVAVLVQEQILGLEVAVHNLGLSDCKKRAKYDEVSKEAFQWVEGVNH